MKTAPICRERGQILSLVCGIIRSLPFLLPQDPQNPKRLGFPPCCIPGGHFTCSRHRTSCVNTGMTDNGPHPPSAQPSSQGTISHQLRSCCKVPALSTWDRFAFFLREMVTASRLPELQGL